VIAQDVAKAAVAKLLEPTHDYLGKWLEFTGTNLTDEDYQILWVHFERLARCMQGLVDFMSDSGPQIGADMSRMNDLSRSLAEMSQASRDSIL
jgi:hypothetical protein